MLALGILGVYLIFINMAYYPLSQITTNLYTNGETFVYLNTFNPYKGYYWKTSKGQFFTGKTPQDTPTQEIVEFKDPINDTFNNPNNPSPVNKVNYFSKYDEIKNIDSLKVTYLPLYSPNIPTEQDYTNGEYRRYFCKKSNEIIYIEINKETYDKLVAKDSTILYQLYRPFNIPWQLTGDKEQVYKTNKNITQLVSTQGNFPMLVEYLKNDFVKYYK